MAERISSWLTAHEMSKADLARATSYHPATVGRWLSAEEPPGRNAMIKIAGAFGVDLSTFFSELPGGSPSLGNASG